MMTATLGEALPPPQPDPRRAMEPYGHVLANGRSVVVRLLAPGDDALMAEFFASLSTREIYYFFPLGDAAARRLATDAPTDRACRVVAVGEHQGRAAILGYMFLEWERDGPPTFGACLRGDAQSSGLGRVLIDHVLSAATACGMERVQLTAHADNWRALRLYQRAGFRLTGEFILQPQGAKQYRMEVDLRIPRPLVWADLTVVARGGLGVGLAAGRIQEAIEVVVGRRPLILDRPMSTDAYALIVSDLAAPWSGRSRYPSRAVSWVAMGRRGSSRWMTTIS